MVNLARLLLLSLFIITSSTFGQYVKVTKILDANLFELEDGRKIKLAGVDAPQLNNPIPFLKNIAEKSVLYSSSYILDRRVFIDTITRTGKPTTYQLVHLRINYLFQKSYFNESYLMKGFGKFIDNVDSTNRNILANAQSFAAKEKEGIWNFYTPTDSDTLDSGLTSTGIHQLIKIDSTNVSIQHSPRPIYFAVPLELLAGSALTFIGSYGVAILIGGIMKPHGEAGLGVAIIAVAAGYSLGFPYGIYLVAKDDNPNLSFLATLGSSLAFALVTSGISYSLFPKDNNHPTRNIPLLAPIIGPLLYVHLFPPAYPTQSDLTPQPKISSGQHNFQNYYNSTMKFRMELLRINF